jgi:hypothetical protein
MTREDWTYSPTADATEREYWKQWARIEQARRELQIVFVTPLSVLLFERIRKEMPADPTSEP